MPITEPSRNQRMSHYVCWVGARKRPASIALPHIQRVRYIQTSRKADIHWILIDTLTTAVRRAPVLLDCVMTPLHWISTRMALPAKRIQYLVYAADQMTPVTDLKENNDRTWPRERIVLEIGVIRVSAPIWSQIVLPIPFCRTNACVRTSGGPGRPLQSPQYCACAP
jgi:hypothetical protein